MVGVVRRDEVVKRMSELLRSGAVMLDIACPLCGTPLFRLRSGEVVCPVHGSVKVVKSDSEAVEVRSQVVLDRLESLATDRISRIMEAMSKEDLEDEEIKLLGYLEKWLEVLERARRLKQVAKEEKK
jgi:UPF0148 protein